MWRLNRRFPANMLDTICVACMYSVGVNYSGVCTWVCSRESVMNAKSETDITTWTCHCNTFPCEWHKTSAVSNDVAMVTFNREYCCCHCITQSLSNNKARGNKNIRFLIMNPILIFDKKINLFERYYFQITFIDKSG